MSLGVVGHAAVKKDPVIPSGQKGGGKAKELSLVRVNVTGQPYDYFRPWQKKAPSQNAVSVRFFRRDASW